MKMALNPVTASQIFKLLGELASECRLDTSPAGWHVSLVDPANVAAVFLDIPPIEFLRYDCTASLQVGIDLTKINREVSEIVESQELEEIVAFTFEPADEKHQTKENDRHKITIEHGMFRREIHSLSPASVRKSPEIPALDLPYSAAVETRLLRRIVNCASQISDYIRLGVRPSSDGLQFYAVAEGDSDDPLTALPPAAVGCRTSNVTGASSLFSLDYMEDIMRAVPDPILSLELGGDSPLIMRFAIGKYGNARYLQAPRIESE